MGALHNPLQSIRALLVIAAPACWWHNVALSLITHPHPSPSLTGQLQLCSTKMSNSPADRRRLSKQDGDGIDLSESHTLASPTLPYQRHGNHRISSPGSADYTDPAPRYTSPNPLNNPFEPAVQGLGITSRPCSIARVPVGSRNAYTPPVPSNSFSPSTNTSSPGSSNPLLSPAWPDAGSSNLDYEDRSLGTIQEQSIDAGDLSMGKNASFANSLDNAFRELDDPRSGLSFTNDDGNDDVRNSTLFAYPRRTS